MWHSFSSIRLSYRRQSVSERSRLLSTTSPTVLACLWGEWGIRAGSKNIWQKIGLEHASHLHIQTPSDNTDRYIETVNWLPSESELQQRKQKEADSLISTKSWFLPLLLGCGHLCGCHSQSLLRPCHPGSGKTAETRDCEISNKNNNMTAGSHHLCCFHFIHYWIISELLSKVQIYPQQKFTRKLYITLLLYYSVVFTIYLHCLPIKCHHI